MLPYSGCKRIKREYINRLNLETLWVANERSLCPLKKDKRKYRCGIVLH